MVMNDQHVDGVIDAVTAGSSQIEVRSRVLAPQPCAGLLECELYCSG